MDFTQFMAVLATGLGIISTVIGLVNSKSKSDKADAVQIRTIEIKLDDAIEDIKDIKANVKSYASDIRKCVQVTTEHATKIEALEARMKKVESKIYKADDDLK